VAITLSPLFSNITALEQTGTGNRARVDGGGGIDTLVVIFIAKVINGIF
jgi:hypothetical protein